ncbi:HK97 family phage prohead protease [Bacteroides faecis]|uniref:HK97 family phage prohead protease n=1 Tax=Bacteroides faecis TaxID=674529 RepID=UPI0039C0FDAC
MDKANKYKGRLGMQYKTFSINSKDVNYDSESRTISGYAAVFGNKDKAGDILIKGCFSKSIQDRGPESSANDKIIVLWMHDMNEPIGRLTVLYEDDKGLYFEAPIDDVPRGNQAIKQLESGTLNQFSIGYQYVWENCEYDAEKDAFMVKEVKLHEISVVSIGCNGETEYLGLKSIEDAEKAYEELNAEISEVCSGMSAPKQQKIQRIISKVISLSSFKPGNRKESSLEGQKADMHGNKVKSMFKNLKLK